MRSPAILSAFGLTALLIVSSARADEGMWLLESPPLAQLNERYQFQPTPEWLEHMQKSCVKMGASGSFVSPHGLILTNHHVGSGQLEKLSTSERNLYEDGFYARTLADEIPCPDMEVMILWSTEDVTEQIGRAVAAGMTTSEAEKARRQKMTEVEEASQKKTGLQSQVVQLYRGPHYHLYRYKRYTDVRLVMAPEKQAAFFGGDTDNFEYPRFDLDVCFFRVYENGHPLEVEHYLKTVVEGARDGDLALVFGHPGRTNRLCTVDHLRFQRDVELPASLAWLWRREVQLATFSARGPENARIAEGDYFGVQNGRKARTGYFAALEDPEILRARLEGETKLRAWVAADPKRQADWGSAWDEIASARGAYRSFYSSHEILDSRAGGGSDLFGIARNLVRMAAELPKASKDRLREYRDTNLESLDLDLYSPAPIYPTLEADRMTSWLSYAVEKMGGDDPVVAKMLAGESPQVRAEQLVSGSRLADIAVRKALAAGGAAAIDASDDPMIRLAAAIDPESRSVRQRYEDEVEGVETVAYGKIGAADFALEAETVYPDATGTLRMAFGPISGFTMPRASGVSSLAPVDLRIPAFTTFAGMYERAEERRGQLGFDLPPRWIERKDRLHLDTPFNFILTADIIGGNSGSPVVNRQGEIVGLIFDGNIESLAWDVAYSDTRGRAVAVDIRAILEALRVMYDAGGIADEMTGGPIKS